MAYTQAQINQATAALQQALPGLNANVAKAWVTAEQGNYNNITGLTNSSGQLIHFNSYQDAATAIANNINTNPIYANLSAAIKSGNAQAQAQALATSPWHLGVKGLALAGGVDTYYAKYLNQFGFNIQYTAYGPSGAQGGSTSPTAIAQAGSAVLSAPGAAVGAVQGAVQAATDIPGALSNVGNQITDTFTWIGFILLGLVFIIGGIVLLKPSGNS